MIKGFLQNFGETLQKSIVLFFSTIAGVVMITGKRDW